MYAKLKILTFLKKVIKQAYSNYNMYYILYT